jgi:RNA polymerase-binding transcription factor
VLPASQNEHFKQVLEIRISELDHALAAAKHEAREGAAKHADPADQAASEYERQSLVHQAAAARQMLKNLTQALERMRQGTFGECAECGGDIELKRLEAIPWARYCVRCQEARERG